MNLKKIQLGAVLLSLTFSVRAQEATTASGGDASGSGGTVAYSVGQVAYSTNTGSNGNELQGVQQPYEILTSGIPDPAYDISLSAFPNPATGLLNLEIGNYRDEKLSCSLYDAQGKLLESRIINAQQTQIDLSNLALAEYLITVVQGSKIIQSFKIIKK
ncbi:MAG: T9SS type A sorting domain-containing protein [Bacteroidia bacterium]